MSAVAAHPADDLPRSPAGPFNPWFIAGVVSLATFMEVLDTTIANVALTHMAGSLGASEDESTWILTSYLVSNTVILPISGWLANVIGRKRFYLICVALFTISSVGCAFATTLPMMLIARVFQGLGGGGLAPVTQSMLADSFPPAKRSQAFGVFGLTVIAAPATGPIIGGWLTDNLSWHWIFLINLPVGLIAFTLISVFISEPAIMVKERIERLKGGLKLDYVGLFLVTVGFGMLQIFLDKFQEDDGFSSPFILTSFIIVIVSLSLLAVWEWQHPYPVMNVRLFKIRNFAVGNILLFFVGFILLSSTQLLPELTQTLLGYDSTTSGFALALGGMFTIGLMPVAGYITGRHVSAKLLMGLAFIEVGIALLLQSSISPAVSFGFISTYRVLQVIALPFIFIPVNSVCYIGVPPKNNGEASALINQSRNLGSSVGISFVNTMLAYRLQFHHARLTEAITPYTSLHGQRLSQIGPMVQTQASFLSYLDMFHLIGIIALMLWPLVFLLKSPPKSAL
ncbi:MAG: DHA2 family efflux MFS transporter permease subunit [Acidocella sp.]|nr:DHA2 family efflux MFS transporter permease subunit [Acidocella sp.]